MSRKTDPEGKRSYGDDPEFLEFLERLLSQVPPGMDQRDFLFQEALKIYPDLTEEEAREIIDTLV